MRNLLPLTAVLCSLSVQADIRLPTLISDNMVLQRDSSINLWGYATAGEQITVRLNDTVLGQTRADNGQWQFTLPAQSAGCGHRLTFSASNSITLNDICFGDVWLASGQSNMELPMARLAEAYPQDLTSANYPQIRQFTVPQQYNFDAPQQDLSAGQWQAASPDTIAQFSALAFYFARDLFNHNGVPIGMLNNALGGSPVEAWLSEEALQAFPDALAQGLRFRDKQLIADITAVDQAKNAQWYGALAKADAGLTGDTPWYAPTLDHSDWQSFNVPGFLPEPFTVAWWL
ncbi:MAG: sialate O-acetylesterase, partial [Gammaproteobacteria bacterium]|nr:sialate O-acetylesterase [Gammaproteobacteria bacterium]MBU1555324.1 sialate O-acetylesterase [Gammaproteobacteria bacterium]